MPLPITPKFQTCTQVILVPFELLLSQFAVPKHYASSDMHRWQDILHYFPRVGYLGR